MRLCRPCANVPEAQELIWHCRAGDLRPFPVRLQAIRSRVLKDWRSKTRNLFHVIRVTTRFVRKAADHLYLAHALDIAWQADCTNRVVTPDTRDRHLARSQPDAEALRRQGARGKRHARRRARSPGRLQWRGRLAPDHRRRRPARQPDTVPARALTAGNLIPQPD
jgi:hypothetical protein